MSEPITAAAIEAVLRERLAPTQLEVIDESAAHAGHAGALPAMHLLARVA